MLWCPFQVVSDNIALKEKGLPLCRYPKQTGSYSFQLILVTHLVHLKHTQYARVTQSLCKCISPAYPAHVGPSPLNRHTEQHVLHIPRAHIRVPLLWPDSDQWLLRRIRQVVCGMVKSRSGLTCRHAVTPLFCYGDGCCPMRRLLMM